MADIPTLAEAIDRLYAAPPSEFVSIRSALVAVAKKAGDKDLAGAVQALRRPGIAAYLVNRLVRDGSSGLDELRDLGERLRHAQSHLDGGAMKTLAMARNDLVARLTSDACTGDESVTPTTKEQVAATFTAALADPHAQAAAASGALVSALRYSGFGEVDLSDAIATPLTLIQGGRAPHAGYSECDRRGTRAAERREAQHAAAQAAAQTRLARARASLERCDDAVRAARHTQDRAQEHLDKASRAVREANAAVERAEADRRTARAAVTTGENQLPG